MTRIQALFLAMILVAAFLSHPEVAYATDELDVNVGLKTLPLLIKKISGKTLVAIIYDANLPESVAEANALKQVFEADMDAPGGAKLSAIMVSTDNLSKMADAKIGFVAKGACTDDVSSKAASYGILTMTSDLECVRSNRCILGVVSRPSVEIYFSKTAADAAKVEFSRSFIMVVKRV